MKIDLSKVITNYQSYHLCTCSIHQRNGSLVHNSQAPYSDAPHGRYPDNYSRVEDIIKVMNKLLAMSPSAIISQGPNSIFGTMTIRFKVGNEYVYVGSLDLGKAKAYLWHGKYFPDGLEVTA